MNLIDKNELIVALEDYPAPYRDSILETLNRVRVIDANEIQGGRMAKIQCADSSCKHCGAPRVLQRRDCPYCGSPYSQAEDRAESPNAIKLPRPMPTVTYDA